MVALGTTGWDASRSRTPFTASLEALDYGALSDLTDGHGTFSLEGGLGDPGFDIEESLLPEEVEVVSSGTRWTLPRVDRVRFSSDDQSYEVLTENGNPSALKLSYSARNGSFKGSFKVYGVTDRGRSKRLTATVNGVVVNGVGYGSAVIRKVGSLPVKIEE